jgi:hypothetical protein
MRFTILYASVQEPPFWPQANVADFRSTPLNTLRFAARQFFTRAVAALEVRAARPATLSIMHPTL